MPALTENTLKQALLAHYARQKGGGGFPVFRGSPVQYGQDGQGFADFFRGVARFFLPILQSTASTFINSASRGLSEGKSLKEAAKTAITPTVSSAMSGISDAAIKKLSGGGRKRRAPKKQTGGAKRRKTAKKPAGPKPKRVYKGRGKKKGAPRKNSKKLSSILNF